MDGFKLFPLFPEAGGRQFGVQPQLEVVERPVAAGAMEFGVLDLFQHALEHIILGLRGGEHGVDFQQLFDLGNDIPPGGGAGLLLGQLGGEGGDALLGGVDAPGDRPGAGEEHLGIVDPLLQEVVGSLELALKRLHLGLGLADGLGF